MNIKSFFSLFKLISLDSAHWFNFYWTLYKVEQGQTRSGDPPSSLPSHSPVSATSYPRLWGLSGLIKLIMTVPPWFSTLIHSPNRISPCPSLIFFCCSEREREREGNENPVKTLFFFFLVKSLFCWHCRWTGATARYYLRLQKHTEICFNLSTNDVGSTRNAFISLLIH